MRPSRIGDGQCVVLGLSPAAGTPALQAPGMRGVDPGPAFGGICLAQQPCDRHGDEIRVGGRRGAIGEGDLQGFRDQVDDAAVP